MGLPCSACVQAIRGDACYEIVTVRVVWNSGDAHGLGTDGARNAMAEAMHAETNRRTPPRSSEHDTSHPSPLPRPVPAPYTIYDAIVPRTIHASIMPSGVRGGGGGAGLLRALRAHHRLVGDTRAAGARALSQIPLTTSLHFALFGPVDLRSVDSALPLVVSAQTPPLPSDSPARIISYRTAHAWCGQRLRADLCCVRGVLSTPRHACNLYPCRLSQT